MVYSIMLPLMTLTFLSVYCLFYYVVWFDFIPINMLHLSTNFCPWTLRMINGFNFVCSTHIYWCTTLFSWNLYYFVYFLVNEGIGLILVIQTFYPSSLSVLYNKDVYPTSSIVWSCTLPFNILNHITLHKTLSYHSYSLYLFYFTDIYYVFILLSCIGWSNGI